jgi:hypothetical protein
MMEVAHVAVCTQVNTKHLNASILACIITKFPTSLVYNKQQDRKVMILIVGPSIL